MKIAFLAPNYPAEMPHFVRGLAQTGVEVVGVGDAAPEQLGDVARYLSRWVRTNHSLMHENEAHDELAPALAALGVDRIESLWEPLVLLAARLRETLGLPGMSYDTVLGFRDKQLMKERVAAAGLRVPRSARCGTRDEMFAAAETVGYPLVVKPIAGAGSADTHLVRDKSELEKLAPTLAHVAEVSIEEYIEGEEFTYDAVSVDGVPVFDSVAQYHPKPLESRTQEWISPAQVVYRDPHSIERLAPGIALGKAVLKALGMESGFTHMEWFLTPSGEAVFGEIGARPPGAKLVDQMNWSNDFDVYHAWAQAVTTGEVTEKPLRKYHSACVFKRAQGRGRITRISGIDAVRNALGAHIIEEKLLPVGTHRRDWRSTLLSDGWIVVRHQDLPTCRSMMNELIRSVRMYAE